MKKLTRIFGVLLLCLALVGAMSMVFSADEVDAVSVEETAEYASSFYNTFYYFIWGIVSTHCINNNSHMYILLYFSI
jgi:hypothetical protein